MVPEAPSPNSSIDDENNIIYKITVAESIEATCILGDTYDHVCDIIFECVNVF